MADQLSSIAPPAPRRSGLGRGLEAAIAHAAVQEPPTQVLARPAHDLVLTVYEDASGIVVRLADEAGREGEAPASAGESSITAAAIAAAGTLTRSPARYAHHDVRRVGPVEVATVLVASPDGSMSAGAAVVTGSVPFGVAAAAVRAFEAAER